MWPNIVPLGGPVQALSCFQQTEGRHLDRLRILPEIDLSDEVDVLPESRNFNNTVKAIYLVVEHNILENFKAKIRGNSY